MNKRLLIILINLILSIVVILGLIYLGLDYCYKDTFVYGTYINGHYCTGMTMDEVNKLLVEECNYDGINVISEATGLSMNLNVDDCSPEFDFSAELQSLFSSQKKDKWTHNLFSRKDYYINPAFSFDENKLDEKLDKLSLLEFSEEPIVKMEVNENGIELTDNMHSVPDVDSMRKAIHRAVANRDTEIVIGDEFYHDLEHTSEQEKIIDDYDQLTSFLKAKITYVMGEDTEVIDESVLYDFLIKDENGNLYIDSETDEYVWDDAKIDEWVDNLAKKYNTVGKTRQFHATGGYLVTVEGGTYGNEIDTRIEKEYLKEAIKTGLVETHEPEYKTKAWHQGIDDIGDTYIEVNMTEQKLYYYVDGEMVIESDVVTGNMARGCDTPSGTNYVYFMQRNRTLIGPNYQTFVYYWIAVVGHIGIHDATWRSKFGDDIYLTDGSHGCINTPTENVSKLYDLVEVGTPAVMFYMDENTVSDVSE